MNTDMKKQTAVEWLLQAIEGKNGKEFSSYYLEFIEQAKEMDKEQMMDAIDYCREKYIDSENYYNENYGKIKKNQ